MRVIAGSRKRHRLVTVEGKHTRPTTDRIKETLFNVLDSGLYQARFLDLFAGSGQIGIEALSRGCSQCYFVENDKAALTCIRRNLSSTGFSEQGKVMGMDAFAALRRLSEEDPFDIIFMDPPYDRQLETKALQLIAQKSLLKEDGLIVVEASLSTGFPNIGRLGFTIVKEKNYKTNKHVFMKRGQVDETSDLSGEF